MKEQRREAQVLACDRNYFYVCRLHSSLFQRDSRSRPLPIKNLTPHRQPRLRITYPFGRASYRRQAMNILCPWRHAKRSGLSRRSIARESPNETSIKS
jgi:hypothetical protein